MCDWISPMEDPIKAIQLRSVPAFVPKAEHLSLDQYSAALEKIRTELAANP